MAVHGLTYPQITRLGTRLESGGVSVGIGLDVGGGPLHPGIEDEGFVGHVVADEADDDVFHRTADGRVIVSNSWRARWGWPSWQSRLRRERTVGVLRVGFGGDSRASPPGAAVAAAAAEM